MQLIEKLNLQFQRGICRCPPRDRKVHPDGVRCKVHQEEEGGDLTAGRGHEGHREGDTHPGRDGAR